MFFPKLHRTIASIRMSSTFCYRGYRQEEQENRLCQVQSSLLSLLVRSTSPHHHPPLSPCSFTLTFRYTLVVDDKDKAAKFERDLPKALPPSERLATYCICHPLSCSVFNMHCKRLWPLSSNLTSPAEVTFTKV